MLLKKIFACITMLIFLSENHSISKISVKTLENYKSIFLSRVIEENPHLEAQIRRYLDGTVMEGRLGVKLLDKFGIFLQNMDQKGLSLNMIRFYSGNGSFCLFMVLLDKKDDQPYTMFVEFEYGNKEQCVLKNIYFSIVFEERMKELKNFFEGR